MKKVCGTCNFQINARAGKNNVEILCPFNNRWYKDNTPGCEKWIEYNNALSITDRINLTNQIKNKEIEDKKHQEIISQSKIKEVFRDFHL